MFKYSYLPRFCPDFNISLEKSPIVVEAYVGAHLSVDSLENGERLSDPLFLKLTGSPLRASNQDVLRLITRDVSLGDCFCFLILSRADRAGLGLFSEISRE